MEQSSVTSLLSRFLPILLIMALILVSSGFFLMLYFGYSIYEIFAHPDQSVFLSMILKNLPPPPEGNYIIEFVLENKKSQISLPDTFLEYGRYLLAFVIWGLLGNLIIALFSSGTMILRLFINGKKTEKMSKG